MSPQDKAKELFDKMYMVEDHMGKYPMCFNTAKECALIAAEEQISLLLSLSPYMAFPNQVTYWQEVEQEIINL
jgi:hypothetical protein